MSQEWYQNTYNRYANQAADIYNSITIKLVDSNGNTTRGYVYRRQDSQVAIQGMIQNLRKVQRDMRDLRQEASRYGYRLSSSTYETIDVKYYWPTFDVNVWQALSVKQFVFLAILRIFAESPNAFGIAHRPLADLRFWISANITYICKCHVDMSGAEAPRHA